MKWETPQAKKKKKRVRKTNLLRQLLWQTDMDHDLSKQELFQGMIIGRRKLNKALALKCVCLYLLGFSV